MFAIRLTMTMLVIVLYVSSTVCWFFWFAPGLLRDGDTDKLIGAFTGTCVWLLTTFGVVIHTMKSARSPAGPPNGPKA